MHAMNAALLHLILLHTKSLPVALGKIRGLGRGGGGWGPGALRGSVFEAGGPFWGGGGGLGHK